eukprot:Skav209389  [mRNA]  locus=scaffold3334:200024:201858:- [translate_table: standard]
MQMAVSCTRVTVVNRRCCGRTTQDLAAHVGIDHPQVTIGFGTGDITGEFAKDTVCFGKGQTKDEMLHLKQEQRRQEEPGAESFVCREIRLGAVAVADVCFGWFLVIVVVVAQVVPRKKAVGREETSAGSARKFPLEDA